MVEFVHLNGLSGNSSHYSFKTLSEDPLLRQSSFKSQLTAEIAHHWDSLLVSASSLKFKISNLDFECYIIVSSKLWTSSIESHHRHKEPIVEDFTYTYLFSELRGDTRAAHVEKKTA